MARPLNSLPVRWFVVLSTILLSATLTLAGDRLVVHEWGTFTTLQDEKGQELPGINIDDEPVPPFVHNLSKYVVNSAIVTSAHWTYKSKGAPRHHPLVTMRLETPVIYFYPPEGSQTPLKLDVSVRFRGGWLTEFYPRPHVEAPGSGIEKGNFSFEKLNAYTIGQLTWNDLLVGTNGVGPTTDWHVWNAPRDVRSAPVTTATGESEKYLFYRGVGRQRSPLRVTLDRKTHEIQLYGNFSEALGSDQIAPLTRLWLVHVRPDGQVAYRTFGKLTVHGRDTEQLTQVSSQFAPDEYAAANLDHLKADMHAALVTDGLYADEATALLSTWRKAYFTSHGLRLFFLVPQAWTDYYLPLSISRSADIARVMVGRVELISDEQSDLLTKLGQTSVSNPGWADKLPDSPAKQRFLAGRSDFGDLGVPLPTDYQLYLELGRFRNALVAFAERGQRNTNLSKFINTYGLEPYRWNEEQPSRSVPSRVPGSNTP